MPEKEQNSSVRICFVMPKAYPLFDQNTEGVFGGAEVDLYLLATEFAKDPDFEIDFVVADYGHQPIEYFDNVRVIKSIDFNQNSLTGAIRIWKALKLSNADIYINKTASLGAGLIACFCNRYSKSFIYRTASSRESDGRYIRDNYIAGKAFKYALRNAKAVFTQNVMDHDNLQQTVGVDSVVIPNGHHLDELPQQERRCILWVGRSADVKGPGKFLSLARRFPDERFVMVCQSATGDNKYDRLLADAAQIDNLQFHSKVPFTEVDSYFAKAKVFVNTSDTEGFANTFIQSAKAAAAILTLNVNPDGFLDKYNCGRCAGGDEQKLSDDLAELLKDNKYIELGQNGRKYVDQFHDITKIVEQYKTIFRDIVADRS